LKIFDFQRSPRDIFGKKKRRRQRKSFNHRATASASLSGGKTG
jgi:hypothetical protein